MDLLELAPPGMVGWMEEFDYGQPMILKGPHEVQVKIVVTPRGISAMALAGQADAARDLLIELGFPPQAVRRLLCG